MNSPFVPDLASDAVASLSPVVLMSLTSAECPSAASRSLTHVACHTASLLPRVPTTIFIGRRVEVQSRGPKVAVPFWFCSDLSTDSVSDSKDFSDQLHQSALFRSSGAALELGDRPVEDFVNDAAKERVHGFALVGRHAAQAASEALHFALPVLLE